MKSKVLRKKSGLFIDKARNNLTNLDMNFDMQLQNINIVSEKVKMSLDKSNQIMQEIVVTQKLNAEYLKILQDNNISLEEIKAYCNQEVKELENLRIEFMNSLQFIQSQFYSE
jgi:hypothetical protein